jgi:acyl-CoA hydrolase
MKFFDIINNKVVIHPDALALPCFNKLWNNDKSKDNHKAVAAIRYIVFKNKSDSPYFKNYSPEKAEIILKREIFGDEKYVLSEEEAECERGYLEINNTIHRRLLQGAYRQLQRVEKFYNQELTELMDAEAIDDIYASISKLKTALQTLELLSQSVANEEESMGRVRGGSDLNPYELP